MRNTVTLRFRFSNNPEQLRTEEYTSIEHAILHAYTYTKPRDIEEVRRKRPVMGDISIDGVAMASADIAREVKARFADTTPQDLLKLLIEIRKARAI